MYKKMIDGQKAYQRDDTEDRTITYKKWLRTFEADGFFMDIDMVKFKQVNGVIKPVAITELTRCDSEQVGERYLQAIVDRFFVRDRQARIIETMAEKLNVPAYLVLFQKDMKWLQVFSFQYKRWKRFTPPMWADFLRSL